MCFARLPFPKRKQSTFNCNKNEYPSPQTNRCSKNSIAHIKNEKNPFLYPTYGLFWRFTRSRLPFMR